MWKHQTCHNYFTAMNTSTEVKQEYLLYTAYDVLQLERNL
jgi:hypothetical protein